jgi:hypothetical protein
MFGHTVDICMLPAGTLGVFSGAAWHWGLVVDGGTPARSCLPSLRHRARPSANALDHGLTDNATDMAFVSEHISQPLLACSLPSPHDPRTYTTVHSLST